MQEVYLLLGSNMGNREQYLHQARILLSEKVGTIKQVSSHYETAAWGVENQPAYINQVLMLETELRPQEVLKEALAIEGVLGRQRIEKWGARIIDIDILFYSDTIIEQPDLKIPHPHFHERRFAIEPMREINPDFIHPMLKKTIKSIALELKDELYVEKLKF